MDQQTAHNRATSHLFRRKKLKPLHEIEKILSQLTDEEIKEKFCAVKNNYSRDVKDTALENVDETVYFEEGFDCGIDVENVIFRIRDRKVVEVLVLKALGFKPREIAKTLGYSNVSSFYQLNFKLKRDYEKIDGEMNNKRQQ